MHGDFSRVTFRPQKRYSAVVAQQGRVQLDAEANEQAAILAYLGRTLAADLIGPHGGPAATAGFAIGYSTPDGQPADLSITEGRYYVDGILVDSTHPPTLQPVGGQATQPPEGWTYWTQPDGFLDKSTKDDQLPGVPFVAYLRVWERFVTAVEDPAIRETALGSALPDTAGRLQVVWQVRALTGLQVPGEPTPTDVRDAFDTWAAGQAATQSRLAVRVEQPDGTENDPCIIHPDARFRGPENQLYRIEVHTDGPAKTATFVWSRDNGSVVFGVHAVEGQWVTLSALGRDDKLDLHVGDWVEPVDDASVARGAAHDLLKVLDVDVPGRRVRLSEPPTVNVGAHPFLRRWDSDSAGTVIEEGTWIGLEDGVQVWFAGGGTYRRGEYWTVPARTVDGDVEWPRADDGTPLLVPPAGPVYHYAPLAWVTGTGDNQVTDLRQLFNALSPV